MADDRGNVQVDVELNPDKALSQSDKVGKDIGAKISESVSKATDTTSSSVNKSLEDIGGQMQSFGSSYSKAVTLPITAIGVASAAAAVNIDTSLTGVRKTVDGTEEDYQRLKDSAIEFSKTNAVDAAQILDIQALGAQLGYDIDQLDQFGQVVSGLDIATNLSAEDAATELAQFANIMGMAKEDTDRYGSTIVELGNNYATTEADISHMAMRIAGAGKQIGLSEADVLGLSTALSSMGIEAEAGGTAISTIMSSIDKSVALNDKNLKTWAETAGMSTKDFAKAWQDNAVDALSSVLVGMDKAVEGGGNMAVMLDELGINSIRQTDVLKRLASNSEYLGDAVGTANKAWEENVALGNEVENFNSSMAGQMEQLKNKATAIAIEIGEPLMGAVLDIINAAEPFVQSLASGAKAFGDLDEGAQRAILMAVGVVAAFGPLATIGGKVTTMLATQGSKWKAFGQNLSNVKTGIINAAKGTSVAQQSFGKYFATVQNGVTTVYKVDKATGTYSQTNSKLARALSTTTTGVKVQNAALKIQNVTMKAGAAVARTLGNAMKTIVPIAVLTIAFELVTALSDAFAKSKEKADLHRDSTKGLTDAAAGLNVQLKAEGDAFSSLGQSASEVDLQQIAEDHRELANSIKETNQSAANSQGMLTQYNDAIQELAGRSDLSEVEVAKLKLAVDGVNESCGTSYTVAQDASGAYQVMGDGATIAKDAVYDLIEAQKAQLRAEAEAENYKKVYEQQQKDQDALTAAIKNANDAEKAYNDTVANTNAAMADGTMTWEEALRQTDAAKATWDEATAALSDAEAQAGSTQSALNKIEEQQTLTAMATAKGADALIKAADANLEFKSGVQGVDVSLTDFTQALKDMGFSSQQVADMSAEDAMKLAEGWKSGYNGMKSAADEVLGEIPQKLEDMGQEAYDKAYGTGEKTMDGYAEGEKSQKSKAVNEAKDTKNKATDALKDSGKAKKEGDKLTKEYGEGAKSKKGEAKKEAEEAKKQAVDATKGGEEQAKTSGQNLVQGFINGIGSLIGRVASKASEMTNAALDAIKKTGKENSPWKTTIQSGKYAAQGLAIGMEKSKKYVKKSASDLSKAIVDTADKRLSKLKRTKDISIGYEVAYWKEIAKHTKKGTKARSEAVQKRKEATKKANDELLKAEKTFKSEVTKIQDNLAKDVKKAWDTYYNAVETRKNAILGSFNLFDRFRVNSQRSSEVLLENLRSQTEAAEEYKSAMDTLRSKIGEGALYEEIAAMGVDALGQIRSLNSMSDAELKEYMELFKRRNEAAKQEAVRENQSLYNETVNTVKKLTDDANKDIQKAAKTLANTAAKLGTTTANSVKKMANSIAKSSKSIIDSVNASIKAIEKLNKKTTTKKSSTKKSSSSSKTKAVAATMSIEPVTYAYDSSGTATGIARTLNAGYMSQIEDSISKGVATLSLAAANGSTTNNSSYNQTVNFNQPISSPDEVARTMRMQQRYGLAGEY